MRRPIGWLALLLGALAPCAAAAADHPQAWPSRSGAYQLAYQSRLAPVPVNRMHSWVLQLRTAAGEPVSGARILVSGGMPAHDHGLPTAPRVTSELAPGDYLLEGLRFHMNGAWELVFELHVDGRRDLVVIPLQL